MKLEGICVLGYARDLFYTQCCVASIREFHPEIPVYLLKDLAYGPYDTTELERALDSDTVLIGPVVRELEAFDEDFVVVHETYTPADLRDTVYDREGLKRLDPEWVDPGFAFNTGQMVATTGMLQPGDFARWVHFHPLPRLRHPEVFKCYEQGVLNAVLAGRAVRGEVTLRRHPFFCWGGSPRVPRLGPEDLTPDSPHHLILHWAGIKTVDPLKNANGHLLAHFHRRYLERVAAQPHSATAK